MGFSIPVSLPRQQGRDGSHCRGTEVPITFELFLKFVSGDIRPLTFLHSFRIPNASSRLCFLWVQFLEETNVFISYAVGGWPSVGIRL